MALLFAPKIDSYLLLKKSWVPGFRVPYDFSLTAEASPYSLSFTSVSILLPDVNLYNLVSVFALMTHLTAVGHSESLQQVTANFMSALLLFFFFSLKPFFFPFFSIIKTQYIT